MAAEAKQRLSDRHNGIEAIKRGSTEQGNYQNIKNFGLSTLKQSAKSKELDKHSAREAI